MSIKQPNKERRVFIQALAAAGLVSAAGPGLLRPARAADKLVVGVIYVGPKDDYGYSQAQAQAAAAIKKLPGIVDGPSRDPGLNHMQFKNRDLDTLMKRIELLKAARESKVAAERDAARLREQLSERDDEMEAQRQELVSRLTTPRVEAHCGAKTYQARKARAEASDHWCARLEPSTPLALSPPETA